jgi:hypothetical protein
MTGRKEERKKGRKEERKKGRKEERKKGRKEERKKGRKEDRKKGRKKERKKSRNQEREKGRKGERKKGRKEERKKGRKEEGRTHHHKTFLYLMNGPSKHECLSLAGLSSKVKCLLKRPEPTRVEQLSGAFLFGWLVALAENIKLSWKSSLETNTIAYLAHSEVRKKKKFCDEDPNVCETKIPSLCCFNSWHNAIKRFCCNLHFCVLRFSRCQLLSLKSIICG